MDLLEGYANVRLGLPSDAAFSQRMAAIKSKVEFFGQVRSAWQLQTGSAIAQIADNTAQCRMVSHHESGNLEYHRPLKAPTLNHDLSACPQFDENHPIANKLPNEKLDRPCSANLRKP
jgi:hypothetical protein